MLIIIKKLLPNVMLSVCQHSSSISLVTSYVHYLLLQKKYIDINNTNINSKK